jgi:hypothetical protein
MSLNHKIKRLKCGERERERERKSCINGVLLPREREKKKPLA